MTAATALGEAREASAPAITSERMASIGRHAIVAVQLALVLLIFHAFDLERSSGILELTPLIFVAFVVHSLLPATYRMQFFVAASLAAFWIILGPQTLIVIAIGLALIGICHLPIRFGVRVALVTAVAVLLAIAAVEGVPGAPTPVVRNVIPVLASIFMFRLIIYLYDLRHERTPISPWMRLAYFFMLPNACFALFPVIDLQAFRRSYYDRAPVEIYQRGVRIILRGATHLLLYRFVYYYLTPQPLHVDGISRVALFLASAWLLFLHVSGVFHVVVGILCLFGFNLPDANRLYFLASSPNEVWRRANIYWKDFMVKVFYLPTYKALQKRKIAMQTAMVVATVVVFAATWMLHSYQWFWLRGRFPLSWVDAAFWIIFALLVLANTLWDLRKGAKRPSLRLRKWTFRDAAVHTLKVMAMFVLLSAMWSWWNTRDTMEWVYMVASAKDSGPIAFAMFGAVLLLIFTAGVAAHYSASRGWTFGIGASAIPFGRSVALTLAASLAILAFSRPSIRQLAGHRFATVVGSLQREHLNARDLALRERSYYESIITTDQSNMLFTRRDTTPDAVPVKQTKAVRFTGDELSYVFAPSVSIRNRGAMLNTNSWGMRDRQYTLHKPAGTYRMAMVGGSVSMASGVEQPLSFEALVEDRLNRERPAGNYSTYEILNFSVGGHGLVQYVAMTERKARDFEPDALVLATLSAEEPRTRDLLGELIFFHARVPPFINDWARRAGVKPSSRLWDIRRKIATPPFPDEIRRWAYKRIVELCRERGIVPVWAYLPAVNREERPRDFARMSADAREAGFVILDLRGAYPSGNRDSLIFDRTDGHPNAKGHALLAQKLYEQLLEHSEEVRLGQLKQSSLR